VEGLALRAPWQLEVLRSFLVKLELEWRVWKVGYGGSSEKLYHEDYSINHCGFVSLLMLELVSGIQGATANFGFAAAK
jgi:hypothetical protein